MTLVLQESLTDGKASIARRVHPLATTFGGEIAGLDLGRIASESAWAEIRELLVQHRVLCFRGQELTAEQLAKVASKFGKPLPYFSSRYRVSEAPVVLRVSNIFENGEPIGVYDGDKEFEWHADSSWKDEMSRATLLHSVVTPSEQGATWFADSTQAYADLSLQEKARIKAWQAVHSLDYLTALQHELTPSKPLLTPDERTENPDAVHPVVLRHPATKRASLLLGSMIVKHLVGVSEDESRVLVNELLDYATQPRYLYKHQWRNNDLVVWDNLAVLHTATPCDHTKHRRLLHRVTVL